MSEVAGTVSIESRARRLLTGIEDLPDWAYMKAIELSRAMDEGELSHESLAASMILLTLALDRRIKILEGDAIVQEYWNVYFDQSLEYLGESFDIGGVLDGDEDSDVDDE